jgi:hypothetical protein
MSQVAMRCRPRRAIPLNLLGLLQRSFQVLNGLLVAIRQR